MRGYLLSQKKNSAKSKQSIFGSLEKLGQAIWANLHVAILPLMLYYYLRSDYGGMNLSFRLIIVICFGLINIGIFMLLRYWVKDQTFFEKLSPHLPWCSLLLLIILFHFQYYITLNLAPAYDGSVITVWFPDNLFRRLALVKYHTLPFWSACMKCDRKKNP